MLLGKAMWSLGLRYRKHYNKLKGKPDYVFVTAKVAVFCDGDFWHRKDIEERVAAGRFQNNKEYWSEKIPRTIERVNKLINFYMNRDGLYCGFGNLKF